MAAEGDDDDYNVGLAFGLVTAAGLSTTFGAAMVYWDKVFLLNNKRILGAALGFAAGVMLYVSFFEILQESVAEFSACGCLWNADELEEGEEDGAAVFMGTLMFGIGILITYALDIFVHYLFHKDGAGDVHHMSLSPHQTAHQPSKIANSEEREIVRSFLETSPNMLDRQERGVAPHHHHHEQGHDHAHHHAGSRVSNAQSRATQGGAGGVNAVATANPLASQELGAGPGQLIDDDEAEHESGIIHQDAEMRDLHRMGILTALAIGLHNFPEGLATLAGTLNDEKIGISLAIAIGIHNIPEGLCVAIPIYYATGSRSKGFWLAFWSGVSEILGAALGYAFLTKILGAAAFGVVLGMVAGMMITIVLKELLPMAHRYDPHDTVVTTTVMIGMGVMALSIVLFEL